MKDINRILLTAISAGALVLTSCSDFDEINVDPLKTGIDNVQPEWAFNQSQSSDQQDPGTAERIMVYNWGSAARVTGDMSFLNVGRYNNDYTDAYYYSSCISKALRTANLALTIIDSESSSRTPHQVAFYSNLKQITRIWRAYLISEFVDCFGVYPLSAFQGVNPSFDSAEDCYDYMFAELAEAIPAIDPSITPDEAEADCDKAYKFDGAKWKAYGVSLWMRLAMRLTNADVTKAQSQFEAAVAAGSGIRTLDEAHKVPESTGWNDYTGVFTRSWNDQCLSSTMANILTNIGGVSVASQRPDIPAKYIKDKDWLGDKYADHFSDQTDDPTKQFFLDGLPQNLDPRALQIFCLPGDVNDPNYIDKYSNFAPDDFALLDEDGNTVDSLDATYCWNGYPAGTRTTWTKKASQNQLLTEAPAEGFPILNNKYCAGTNERMFFGPWETYFLLAEAAERGWNVGITAKQAYETGVRLSFDYFGVSQYADAYLQSKEYNRVGCSANFDDTTEPTAVTMRYADGYTGEEKTMEYRYPSTGIYRGLNGGGHPLNDHLSKIITQKYIANTPYLALEMWSDHRRLGLPFFDTPANDTEMTGCDMQSWICGDKQQEWNAFPQRLRLPESLQTTDPDNYNAAVSLLKGDDTTMTPIWWSLGYGK